LIASAPVRRGRVLAFAFRSKAAVEEERSGDRPGPRLKRSGRGLSIDLIPKVRFCDNAAGERRRLLGRRKGGGSWIAKLIVVLGEGISGQGVRNARDGGEIEYYAGSVLFKSIVQEYVV
jgi:hypothetical protein